jgi:hypothetical protein
MGMPFLEATFGLVVSRLAIHNIKGQFARFKALDAAFRMLTQAWRRLCQTLSRTGYGARDGSVMDWPCWFARM